MTLSEDPELVSLFSELETAVQEQDRCRIVKITAMMSWRLLVLHQGGQTIPEDLELLFAELAVINLGEIESIGTLDAPAIKRELTRFGAAPAPGTVSSQSTEGDEEKDRVIRLWFGTNRKETSNMDLTKKFSSDPVKDVTYGFVDVFVPESHRFGETGRSFWKRILKLEWCNDNLKIQEIRTLTSDDFWKQVAEHASDGDKSTDGLVFIHGFNNTFAQTAVRAAQIGFDLQFPGLMAFFSWPSQGMGVGYVADETSIERSEPQIEQFLVDFVKKSGARKVHVIAHSMGNRGFLRSMERIARNASLRDVPLGNVILAAPDVDREIFIRLTTAMKGQAAGVTLYSSQGDKAVNFSSVISSAPRAGYFDPVTCGPDFMTITVEDFDLDFLGHAYFAQSEKVMKDIHHLVTGSEPRPTLAAKMADGIRYWHIGE